MVFEGIRDLERQFRRGRLAVWMRRGLQCISFAALCVALSSAVFIVVFHTYRVFGGPRPAVGWTLKSAVPLIAVGVSYISLIVTDRGRAGRRVLGILVGTAFILWGIEQYLADPAIISYIDDVVVFLFVLDLGFVIQKNLRKCSRER